jgi:putative phage-type endonuclease
MSTIMRLVQGSPEWHAHRKRYRNASETPAVLGVSPWCTPYQLWQQKLGLVQPEVSNAMLHGTQLEPAARAAYEARTGHVMQPLVLVDGEYSASLDGLTLGGDRILEVKCPYQGRASTLWDAASAGELPEHYWWQVQHQLLVAGAALADVFVFDGTEGLLLEVQPKPESWVRIRSAWDAFAQNVAKAEPPALTERDVRVREDPEWLEAAAAYLELRTQYEALGTAYDEAKARLIALATHPKEQGCGVSVARFWKRGGVDYKRVTELAGVDLEQYRARGREEVRVTVEHS